MIVATLTDSQRDAALMRLSAELFGPPDEASSTLVAPVTPPGPAGWSEHGYTSSTNWPTS